MSAVLKCKTYQYRGKAAQRKLPYRAVEGARWYQSTYNRSPANDDVPAEKDFKPVENRPLLLSTSYNVSLEKYIIVGLDVENNFEPTVQFLKENSRIPALYFNAAEWKLLDSISGIVEENFKNEITKRTYEISSNLTLSFWLFYNSPCMKILDLRTNGAVFLTAPTWKAVLDKKSIVNASLGHVLFYAPTIREIYDRLFNEAKCTFRDDSDFECNGDITKNDLESVLNHINYKEKFNVLEIDGKTPDVEFGSAFMSLIVDKLLRDLNAHNSEKLSDCFQSYYFDDTY